MPCSGSRWSWGQCGVLVALAHQLCGSIPCASLQIWWLIYCLTHLIQTVIISCISSFSTILSHVFPTFILITIFYLIFSSDFLLLTWSSRNTIAPTLPLSYDMPYDGVIQVFSGWPLDLVIPTSFCSQNEQEFTVYQVLWGVRWFLYMHIYIYLFFLPTQFGMLLAYIFSIQLSLVKNSNEKNLSK